MIVDEELAERFVRENWTALAAAAWRFHLRHGRGAVIVEWALVERWRSDRSLLLRPRYATATEDPRFNTVIAGYEPRTDIVIAFADSSARNENEATADLSGHGLQAGTGVAAMTVTAQPAPPIAHRALGH
jgi:hypothetical protein